MRKVIVFEHVTLDGYFADENGDMSWAHSADEESNAFAAENAMAGGPLLFGRVTYEMMASFWPTPAARAMNAVLAEQMTKREKVVFSRTLREVSWANTKLVGKGLADEVRRMKQEPGEDLTILGSGSVVAQLAQEDLIDGFNLVVNPIVLGKGRSMFAGLERRLALKPTTTRRFANGNVLSCYEIARS